MLFHLFCWLHSICQSIAIVLSWNCLKFADYRVVYYDTTVPPLPCLCSSIDIYHKCDWWFTVCNLDLLIVKLLLFHGMNETVIAWRAFLTLPYQSNTTQHDGFSIKIQMEENSKLEGLSHCISGLTLLQDQRDEINNNSWTWAPEKYPSLNNQSL